MFVLYTKCLKGKARTSFILFFFDKQFSSPEHFIRLGLNRVYWDLYNT